MSCEKADISSSLEPDHLKMTSSKFAAFIFEMKGEKWNDRWELYIFQSH